MVMPPLSGESLTAIYADIYVEDTESWLVVDGVKCWERLCLPDSISSRV